MNSFNADFTSTGSSVFACVFFDLGDHIAKKVRAQSPKPNVFRFFGFSVFVTLFWLKHLSCATGLLEYFFPS
jgi:hypothetical protein